MVEIYSLSEGRLYGIMLLSRVASSELPVAICDTTARILICR